MKTITLISLTTILLAASACSGGGESTTAGTGGSVASASSGSGATSSSGTGSETTSSSTGGSVGDTVTVEMTPFVVPAGGEVYKCQNFSNPFGGQSAEVAKFESHMTPGSHHLLLFYKQGATDSPQEDCSGLEFAATPYSTQLPDDEITYPDGVAALIPPTTGLRMQSHYLNTTGQDLTAKVSITFHLAKSGTVTAHAGVLFVVDPKINIPPQQTGVVKHDCNLPFDMNLVKVSSHMHKHGTNFVSTIGDKPVFNTTQWDEPTPALFSPAMSVKGGEPLSFSCTFKNDSAQALTFGESAESNEMCIFVGVYYPVPNDALVTVGCN
ncbi:Hypothetical protein A7982_03029 [Minicystis rosea]|nr:Hypothetical protein A7982_03029 [Minicystis rosea]